MTIKVTTDNSFEKDVKSTDKIVIIDFWAEWCGPCKQIAPILDEIYKEKNNQIQIFKINVDDNPETPQKYNVRGIPTLMIFKDGNLIDTKVGSLPKSSLDDWINDHL